MSPPVALEHLLAHEQFVRGILRSLLRDETQVDDTLQDVWLRTLQRPGSGPREPRTWLARIARNCAASNWRSDRRRQQREHRACSEAVAESAEQSQQRVELRHRVVTAILALDEPYRSVVLLRYEQHLPVAAVAERLRRSAATVRSQLSRAHARLRRKLDRDYDGRERWAAVAAGLLAVVPAAGMPAGAVGVGVLTLVAAWAVWLLSAATPVPVPDTAATTAAAAGTLVPAEGPFAAIEVATAPDADREVPAHLAADVLLLPPAELFDRSRFDDYERATFSFLWGTRDDPDLQLTHNDWDILFGNGRFRVATVTDDHSVIADLGVLAPEAFGKLEVGDVTFGDGLAVFAGHAYAVLTRDSDSELATVVFVRDFAPGRTVRFDWYATDGTPKAQGSLRDPGNGRPWTEVLRDLRLAHRRGPPPVSPVVLQLRGGAGGGNPNRIDFAGRTNGYVRERAEQPLDVFTAPDSRERIRSFASTGFVPPDHCFVVTDVVWRGGARGDSNGPGGFRVCIAGQMLAELETRTEPIEGSWRGEAVIPHGGEAEAWFETRNSSWGEVRLFGGLEVAREPDGRFAAANHGFRSGLRPASDPTPTLAASTIVLQAKPGRRRRSASVDLRGRVDERIGALQAKPIDLMSPGLPDDCLAYANGGLVPLGHAFVVTSATVRGQVSSRALPFDGLSLVLAGETVLKAPGPGPYEATWTGHAEIAAGEETRTRFLVGDECAGEVELRGELVRR